MCILALLLGALVAMAAAAGRLPEERFTLPDSLLIGAGTSAFQTEGAWNEEGKAESGLDHMLHSGKLADVGYKLDPHLHDRAADSYHRFREDVAMAAQLKLKVYRFSISWARVLPSADASKPNAEGVRFYHQLIDEIIGNGMRPMVTLYHFDHPLILETQFEGWNDRRMVDKFEEYSKFAFDEYGKKVDLWISFNEPNVYCLYFGRMFVAAGMHKQDNEHKCVHHSILAHAKAYRAFKSAGHKGMFGFSAFVNHATPATRLPEDVFAAEAFNMAQAGLLLHPLRFGDYPELVKELSDIPTFSDEEKTLVKGAADFFGFNIYGGVVATYQDPSLQTKSLKNNVPVQTFVKLPFVKIEIAGAEGKEYGSVDAFSLVTPESLRHALVWAWQTYQLPIVITENGMSDSKDLHVHDRQRAVYHSAYLRALVSTVNEMKVNVIAYLAWSLIDSFEWSSGYTVRFGLVHVDYAGASLNRTLKDSHTFWTELADTRVVPLVEADDVMTTTTAAAPSAGARLMVISSQLMAALMVAAAALLRPL